MLNSRGVAFVTYVNEANAEFAKEAMAHQYVFSISTASFISRTSTDQP